MQRVDIKRTLFVRFPVLAFAALAPVMTALGQGGIGDRA